MEKVPVLFLIDVLYTAYGGAEGVLRKMVLHLPPDRYRCSIATFSTRSSLVAVDEYPCPVHLFPIRRMYDWEAFLAGLRLARLVKSEGIQILHTFFPASDLLGGIVGNLSGCPIVISSRRDTGSQRSAAERLAYRCLGRRLFDQVHAVSDCVRKGHIRQDRLDPNKVVTVHNGVDLREIDAAPKTVNLSGLVLSRTQNIVCVANLRPIKNIEMLLRTAAIVRQQAPLARFLIVGSAFDQEYSDQVGKLAQALDVNRTVTFTGPSSEVVSILKACDIFFLPSRSEGLSNAILEAMACRLPCVVTAVGGNPELVHEGSNGYLVPLDDAEVAAARILELLRCPDTAKQMGDAGRRIVQSRFSVETMIRNLTGLYEGLLAGSGRTIRAEQYDQPLHSEEVLRD